MVHDRVSEEVFDELAYICVQVWEKYLTVKSVLFDYDALIKTADEFSKDESKRLFEKSGIKFLNLSVIDSDLLKSEE